MHEASISAEPSRPTAVYSAMPPGTSVSIMFFVIIVVSDLSARLPKEDTSDRHENTIQTMPNALPLLYLFIPIKSKIRNMPG